MPIVEDAMGVGNELRRPLSLILDTMGPRVVRGRGAVPIEDAARCRLSRLGCLPPPMIDHEETGTVRACFEQSCIQSGLLEE